MTVEYISAVLAEHRMTTGPSADVYCTCGWHGPATPGQRRRAHDRHVAEMLA